MSVSTGFDQTDAAAPAVYRTELPDRVRRGKVRDVYRAGGRMLIVATDRISAFDVVMNEPVPGKGVILTQMSRFWLQTLPAASPHHLEYVVSDDHCPDESRPFLDQLRGRAMLVKRLEILPIECVVRGYLIGGGWKEYQATGTVSGLPLPPGLRKAERLPEPLFTPSTKAEVGHDQPVSFEQCIEIVQQFLATHPVLAQRTLTHRGAAPQAADLMERARRRSLELYQQAADYAAQRGIILADTKFEFGLWNDELLLADEVLTPDSSRFWPADQYRVDSDPPSFDKQFLRDYLETLHWNKQPPPPPLPSDILAKTRERYETAWRLLTA